MSYLPHLCIYLQIDSPLLFAFTQERTRPYIAQFYHFSFWELKQSAQLWVGCAQKALLVSVAFRGDP